MTEVAVLRVKKLIPKVLATGGECDLACRNETP
jgi:hypothetical protein